MTVLTLVQKKCSATGSASEYLDLDVANAIENHVSEWHTFWNFRFLFGFTTKGDMKISDCIVNIEQHNFAVAQAHDLRPEEQRVLAAKAKINFSHFLQASQLKRKY